ncbi:MAG TPA: hypothetical protein VIH59_20995, partial [Candidatus Tectomicrobia bacterium]
ALPEAGLLLSARLATRLHVQVGDRMLVETLEGKRLWREARVTGLSDDVGWLAAWGLVSVTRTELFYIPLIILPVRMPMPQWPSWWQAWSTR